MIGRRGFLGFLAASPAIGRSQLMQIGMAANALPPSHNYPGDVNCADPVSLPRPPAYDFIHAALRRIQSRDEQSRYAAQGHLPVHIETKKSWSRSFKASIAASEADDHKAITDVAYGTDSEKLHAVARLLGFEG